VIKEGPLSRERPGNPSGSWTCYLHMQKSSYYREQAARARHLAGQLTTNRDAAAMLQLASDLDEIAIDLERGAVEIKHPELLPQRG
jgi:hypothetical protein